MWDKIKKEWVEGKTPIAQIARKYGITRTKIYNRAKKEKWGDRGNTTPNATPNTPQIQTKHIPNTNQKQKVYKVYTKGFCPYKRAKADGKEDDLKTILRYAIEAYIRGETKAIEETYNGEGELIKRVIKKNPPDIQKAINAIRTNSKMLGSQILPKHEELEAIIKNIIPLE